MGVLFAVINSRAGIMFKLASYGVLNIRFPVSYQNVDGVKWLTLTVET